VRSEPQPAGGLLTHWLRFWFEPVPPHGFAIFRIAVGLAGIATILGAWDLAFWRVDGLAPTPGGGMGVRSWILERGLAVPVAVAFRTALLAGYAALTLGVWSTPMSVAMFVASSAMLWWNWYPFSGAQHLLHNLTLYVIFMDSGAVWSWDARRRRARAALAPATPPVSWRPIWPLRLVRAQMAIMYFAAGLWKLGDPYWRSGEALHYVLSSNVFQRMPGVVPPDLFALTVLLTYVTLFWELLFPFLLWWRPTRVLAIGIGVMLHVGMWATIEIGAFSLTVLAGYTAFMNPHLTERRVNGLLSFLTRGRTISDSPSPVS
jgi:hypothetical protein